jgi:tRNA (mo5U34)-methyltransferase
MKCLDIGPMDGPMTFELERRGAHTAALDVQDPTRVGFDAARRILGSKVVHYQGSVYDLPFEDLRDLDLVVFRGVYYHLKYPLLAFERISAAMRVGGMLHFEGAALLNYAEDLEGKPVEFRPDFVAEWNDKRVPVCLSYPNRYLGASNWFIPNPACLESWLIASGFEVHQMTPYIEGRSQRLYGRAVKTTNTGALLETDLY